MQSQQISNDVFNSLEKRYSEIASIHCVTKLLFRSVLEI